jgi:hypothetical protein
MEDVLDVYMRPYDPDYPLICMDEMPKQLLGDHLVSIEPEPGQLQREDYTYARCGAADTFMFCEPLAGKRHVEVFEQRRRLEWAEGMRIVSDVLHPQAKKIVVVLDNLNTHKPASFYQAFEPEEAHRLANRFEFHHTPKHGSWLNMAEIEFSALTRQCLNRRIPDIETLKREILAWEMERNSDVVKVHWRFTTGDARLKLRHLYPKIHD